MANGRFFIVMDLHVILQIVVVVEFFVTDFAFILSRLMDEFHVLSQIFELEFKKWNRYKIGIADQKNVRTSVKSRLQISHVTLTRSGC